MNRKPRQLRINGLYGGARPEGRLGLMLDMLELNERIEATDAALDALYDAGPEWWGAAGAELAARDYDAAVERAERERAEDAERMRKVCALLAPHGLRYWWGPTQGAL